jgi:hypothetical protein
MRLLRGYLGIDPASYDLLLNDSSQPFFDYLNIRYVYVPDGVLNDPKLIERYRGPDGVILENTEVLPRYFLVSRFSIEPNFDHAVWRSRDIRDFRVDALVDHIPDRVARTASQLLQPGLPTPGGDVRVLHYGHNETTLEIESAGWNLLVSSDVHWPGWRAYWNGERQPPVIVNGAFLGCFIPPGEGRLTFRYVPTEFTQALRFSGGTLVLLLFAGFIRVVIKRRRLRSRGSERPRTIRNPERGAPQAMYSVK